ncbi:CoA-binding protein [Clostridium sp.]|uniref:CoA-binding protein n=1 Tax=Clostridium sp. TaxID=1506 RepID=UPI002FC77E8B
MNEMLNFKTWALLGATPDESRFGYKILKRLAEKGYVVHGINPKYNEIEGMNIYRSVQELPSKVEAINIIVNPKVAMNSLEEIKKAGIKNLWFQPGSFDEEVINKAKEMGFNVEYDQCLYVELGKL